MEFILLSPPENKINNEIDFLIRFFEEGLNKFHLRKPNWEYEQIKAYIEAIPAKFHSKIVIHSAFSLIHKFDLGGLHWPERYRKKGKENDKIFQQIKNKNLTVSSSFHSIENLINTPFYFDYGLLSPVFDSISKSDYKAGFDLQILSDKLYKSKFPVIALGGIHENNLLEIKKTGFYGAAVLGAVWEANDPLEKFKRIFELTVNY